jgi:hypothetical protein
MSSDNPYESPKAAAELRPGANWGWLFRRFSVTLLVSTLIWLGFVRGNGWRYWIISIFGILTFTVLSAGIALYLDRNTWLRQHQNR